MVVIAVVALGLVDISAFSHPKLALLARKEQWVHVSVSLGATGDSDNEKTGGYKFGDISKKLAKRITGKKTYEFGDVSRHLDQRAKDSVSKLTNKTDYEFGDLTRWADSYSKEKSSNFTSKSCYETGDISKEVLRRARSGQYSAQDMYLPLPILLSAVAISTPLLCFLPLLPLLALLTIVLAGDLTGYLVAVLAGVVDYRLTLSITRIFKY